VSSASPGEERLAAAIFLSWRRSASDAVADEVPTK
jgi:hypothetical protein